MKALVDAIMIPEGIVNQEQVGLPEPGCTLIKNKFYKEGKKKKKKGKRKKK
jgi:hypothetical protein